MNHASVSPEDVRYLSPCQLRHVFNGSLYPRIIAEGGLQEKYIRDELLKEPEKVNEPPGTRGQVIRYLNADGIWLVEVARYLRPDGRIGASGRLDPKRMIHGEMILSVDTQLPKSAR